MTEYVYKLKNGKVISACADEKGSISITKDAFEMMVNSWNDGYQKSKADAIDEFQEWLKTQIVGIDNKTKEILVVREDRWELAIDEYKKQLKEHK